MSKVISIYTDGSHSQHNNTAGFGIVFLFGSRMKKFTSDCYKDSTNNRMELKAIIHALEKCKPGYTIDVYSDSQYCVDSINKWLPSWYKRGIIDKKLNADLWMRFLKIKEAHEQGQSKLTFIWIRGHSHNNFNKTADELANNARYSEMKIVCKHNN